ncbi:fructosamine kinase family protein [Paraflavitalea sp. CAU 1676]|uniref:fructosamine kinase family protein n=1 Tax=Paraflavitalea sp. CAU 1676 TaxID=3032598 RepID=UPI0023DB4EDE|nr:fructosamine kinase family protein [Paraflavitalea sp. CAU 1676]MDF2189809.1 fructosamine kinase family protein [Paraflavitalea sp. CAU 1676]
MVPVPVYQYILELLRSVAGNVITSLRLIPVGGGSINETYQALANNGQRFFVKVNRAAELPGLFRSEKEGLELLAAAGAIRTPLMLGCAETEDHQVLVLEWIEQGLKSATFWERFGEQLAVLHGQTQTVAPSNQDLAVFGLPFNNYMGALPQQNGPLADWDQFFIVRRLEPQVKLAFDRHLISAEQAKGFEGVYKALPVIFGKTAPVLVHGDLWSGNFLCDTDSRPVLIDPAVYYGHPAVDLGMTTLFGGFEALFYESYHQHAPPPANYREQWEVANLYPLLIHLNLFGKGYLPDILSTIDRY